jgi:DNA invertase Pin-like site-specific DNA recombinase
MTQKKRLRCAIYTRKSTEEGLDMAFNSLDAQREACAAYALSQKSEGWTVLPTLYDDGGFSGGSMERPALARLLADVQSGKVDVVIVYKVDRLTRSLNDFARIVDVFDAAGASFVSVTQQFNTTTSMGRLTLNVLLSFAQFEREVIAERVRDKIAQSKAKGMWMGGTVPFGYKIIDKKLVPNADEAKTVQHIYRRYLTLPSVMALMEELEAEGIFNRPSKISGQSQPFVRGPLHYLLSNPTYIGKVRHKGQIHGGEHEAIIDQPLWEAVQEKRRAAIGMKRERGNGQHASLLTGMIRDHLDRPMSPSHAVKQQRRYRYYVSSMAAALDDGDSREAALRLPATELERAVVDAISDLLADERTIMTLPQADAQAIVRRGRAAQALATKMVDGSKAELRQQLQCLGLAIRIQPERIEASISQRLLVAMLDKAAPAAEDDGVRIPILIPTRPDRRGHNLKLVLRSEKDRPPQVNPTLIALLAKAEDARQQLFANEAPSRDHKLERVARLAFLAPDIVNAIMEGRQPPALTTRRLMQLPRIPLEWQSQRKVLGF